MPFFIIHNRRAYTTKKIFFQKKRGKSGILVIYPLKGENFFESNLTFGLRNIRYTVEAQKARILTKRGAKNFF